MKVSEIFENAQSVEPAENDSRWEVYAKDEQKGYTCYHIPRFKAKPNEMRFKHVLGNTVIFSASKQYPTEMKQKMNEAIDNGPRGRVKTDNITYGQTRNMTGGVASKSELAKRRSEIKAAETAQKNARKEYEKMIKQKVDAKFAPKKKVDLEVVARKIEEVLGNTFPDGDPIDWLAPWFKKTYGMEGLEIGDTLNKAVKKLGRYKDYYDYLAQTWDEYSADFPGLEGRGNPWR